jgi:hypothetical protein
MDLNLNTILAGGVGGVAFFAAWVYLIVKWMLSWDFFGGF